MLWQAFAKAGGGEGLPRAFVHPGVMVFCDDDGFFMDETCCVKFAVN